MKRIAKTQPGFTFVELMFAIVVLGTMLSITMSIFVGMLRFYAFSNQIRQNQENGRNILDTMDREIRFSQLVSAPSTTQAGTFNGYLCIYNQSQRLAIKYYQDGDTLRKVEWKSNELPSERDCSNQNTTKILNLPKMKIVIFGVTKTQGAQFTDNPSIGAVIINLGFITGTPDSTGKACDPKNIYCNKLEYNTVVNLRQ